jgi:hypothetical protein
LIGTTISRPFRVSIRPFKYVVIRPGRYAKHEDDYVSRFNRSVRKWRAETAYLSSTTDMFEHPSFIKIVQMGPKAAPLIISEISRQPDLLLGALPKITGENPVPSTDRGDIYAMASAWIEWYRRRS